MKKILGGFLAVLLSVLLVSCGGVKPEDVVKQSFKEIKEDKLEDLISSSDLSKEELAELKKIEPKLKELEPSFKVVQDTFKGEIISSEISEDGNTAVVKTKVTAVDFNVLFSDVMSDIFSQAFSKAFQGELKEGEDISDEEATNMIIDSIKKALDKDNVKTATNEIDIKLEKKDSEWKIVDEEDIMLQMFNLDANALKDLTDIGE
ncbi:hypothetical protein [Clostridium mediterraneense]|uniref:hypothetical protein n=1 Tax=Clostridium mediterraneense TaxID=1805472 RepID=UPI00082F646A|nr:hypothetical protein [Clostridium mediterraneense]